MCVETACVPVRSVPDSNALAPCRALNQLDTSSMQRFFSFFCLFTNPRVYRPSSALAEHRMPQPRAHWLINTVGSWTRRLAIISKCPAWALRTPRLVNYFGQLPSFLVTWLPSY